jgi:pimeloyl-ACP methyl ester carboxylesterase
MGCHVEARHPLQTREDQLPTLILVGERDPSTPRSVAYGLSDAIPSAKVKVIPDASHIVTVEAPSAVSVALKAFRNDTYRLDSLQAAAPLNFRWREAILVNRSEQPS